MARARHENGRVAESCLQTPEAYTFTAQSAVAIAERVAAGEAKPGFQTPAALFGADFPLELAGVRRSDRS